MVGLCKGEFRATPLDIMMPTNMVLDIKRLALADFLRSSGTNCCARVLWQESASVYSVGKWEGAKTNQSGCLTETGKIAIVASAVNLTFQPVCSRTSMS